MAEGFCVDGMRVDGSWMLTVFITDIQVEKKIRVRGDMHVGGVLYKLVEGLEGHDWSDHALFWPDRNQWLLRTKSTLDQYSVNADASLILTPMHKTLRLQLPDLRYYDCNVDFSVGCFNAVIRICKELGIRHPEELSLAKPLESRHLRCNYQSVAGRGVAGGGVADTNTFITRHNGDSGSTHSSNNSLDRPSTPARRKSTASGTSSLWRRGSPTARAPNSPRTPLKQHANMNGTWRSNTSGSPYNTLNGGGVVISSLHNTTMGSVDGSDDGGIGRCDSSLANSPAVTVDEARRVLVRPRSLLERARLNVAWLDSSLSIMEQGVREFDTLRLRFKFYDLYDLDDKYDSVRINMLYEQAKWQILNEEVDCTEEEMLLFAGLQLQAQLQSQLPQSGVVTCDGGGDLRSGHNQQQHNSSRGAVCDDIDSALDELQVKLESADVRGGDGGMSAAGGGGRGNGGAAIMQMPELSDYLRYFRARKFTMKAYKRYWFVCRELTLLAYKSEQEAASGARSAVFSVSLKGCEVTPDINIASDKFVIKLNVPSTDGMTEMCLRCDSEHQYARWTAACRLASRGHTIADASFEAETASIRQLLSLQRPAVQPVFDTASMELHTDDYVPAKFSRRFKQARNECQSCVKPASLNQRILDSHANVANYGLTEAKMNYIKTWQSLPGYGVSYFVVKFVKAKKEELFAVSPSRLMRLSLSGEHISTWRYNCLKAWNVNWEVRHMMVQFDNENAVFECLSADCKVVHEFIGGYIFLQMRSKDSSQTLDQEMFHKLTGGWC